MNTKNRDEGTVWDHIYELRSKLLIVTFVVIIGGGVAHYFNKEISSFLLGPLGDKQLVFLSPLEPLLFILKIDFFTGLLIALPVISWSLFSFVRPALSQRSFLKMIAVYLFSLSCVCLGLLYTYFIVMPLSLKFLFSITIPNIQSLITAQSYINFLLVQSFLIILVFQIPLIVLAGTSLKIFSVEKLSKKRGYIYVGSVIIFSIITPTTDLFNLGIILLPSIVIFEGSLILARIFELTKSKRGTQ
jgi:sec-independent protein translocase protein TatC